MVAVVMGPRSKRTPRTGDPRLPGPFRTGQVVTRGTPPRMEGCRPANRGFALALVTCFERRTSEAPAKRCGLNVKLFITL